ncbi:hypothetical protein M011DRAFT_323238 [Sporormia fimetaria CBS 119925]|uniref:Mid2 domain-containing protein n=1 Tax=Sporormia fimetaria CBS 119925 TaxID=1340428 RepID=A0A6A6VH60_9PLEO|nr:hypothetical protein M011DRAFT_323238 [Sporormia fimetaria CBS 119925]
MPPPPDPASTKHSTVQSPVDAHRASEKAFSSGAIIGIAVGGGMVVIGTVLAFAFYCFKNHRKGKGKVPPTSELSGRSVVLPKAEGPTELDGRAYARSEPNSTAAYSSYHSQPTTPFSPEDVYSRHAEDINAWGNQNRVTPVELSTQRSGYFVPADPGPRKGSLQSDDRYSHEHAVESAAHWRH